MKLFFIFLNLLLFNSVLTAQTIDFPKSWEGIWKGEVIIFSASGNHEVSMSLVIQPIDSAS